MLEVRHYLTIAGKDVFQEWLAGLRDRQAQARVQTRIDRLERGLLGDAEPCGEGVWELRVDWGPGYRVYYARSGERIILLLLGGDKRKQQADIERAKEYWRDYQQRKKTQVQRPR
jgi:putative addiction module killer protein